MYEALDLQSVFFKYEEDSYNRLKSLTEQCSASLPPSIFMELANKIYKQRK
jgi:farnesyl diphosphate synthase